MIFSWIPEQQRASSSRIPPAVNAHWVQGGQEAPVERVDDLEFLAAAIFGGERLANMDCP
jgi:hypothetical protein